MRERRRVAVIGGGIAGLSCARRLAAVGCAVRVFDKGREPGGRAATRRANGFAFDHGAQYLTARDPRFHDVVRRGCAIGLIAPWNEPEGCLPPATDGDADGDKPASAARWVTVPGMSALARCLLGDFEVRRRVRIETIERGPDGWRLETVDGPLAGAYDTVVIAVPAPQLEPLLAAAPALAKSAAPAAMAPCWALMLGFDTPLCSAIPAAASVSSGPLAWICHDGAKPGRGAGGLPGSWVAHATPAWSQAHLEDDAADVARLLLQAFAAAVGMDVTQPAYMTAHRWRYARVETALGEPFLFDPEISLGACGDWCIGAKIEAAYLSGLALAEHILGQPSPARS